MKNIIVIAPHADDEVIGCGATIAKHTSEGDKVSVIIATNAFKGAPELFKEEGILEIRREATEAHHYLGVEETIFFDFPAPALNAFPEFQISLRIAAEINRLKADTLYLPHPGDIHQDHKAIYRASLVAARPLPDTPVKNIYCYETLSETEWAPSQEKSFIPNHFVNVTDVFEKKIEAFKFFKSQIKEFPHPRSLECFEALGKFRGATVGVAKAEAFIVERQIII